MPSIYRIGTHFYLRDETPNETGIYPIYLQLNYKNHKLRLSTGHKVYKKKWDALQQRVIGTDTAAKSINNQLDTLKARVIEATNAIALNQRTVTLGAIKAIISDKADKNPKTLLIAAERHNEEMKTLVKLKYCYKTYQYYATTAAFLKLFIKQVYKQNDILLEELDLTFAKRFENWILLNTKSTNNGMAKHIQRLKKIINWSIKEGWIGSNAIHTYRITFDKHERGFLTNEEISLLENAKPTQKPLIAIQELFLFQIYTGLAFADLKTLDWKHIQHNHEEQDWIIKPRDKTSILTTVPLLPKAKQILAKRDLAEQGPIFHVYANQHYNRLLKLLAQEIGLKKRLTSHLARHTFATTITLSNGIPIETVSKMLGHTMISTTQIYSKVTIGKIAADMNKLNDKF